MKKGQVVIPTELLNGSGLYLTEGKEYTVVSGFGDECKFGEIKTQCVFEIVNDIGSKSYCRYPVCSHAKWSISE